MSLLKKHIKKGGIKNIETITEKPSFYILENDTNETLCDAFIELNNPFKMIKIEHSGYSDPVQTDYNGMNIVASRGVIYVINMGRVTLDNNYLFSFGGIIEDIKFVKVYPWKSNAIHANITNSNKISKNNISSDDNIIDKDSIKIEDIDLPFTEITNMSRPVNIKTDNKVINGLYSNGAFYIKNKKYTGYYHYYKDKKIYMTGEKPSNNSVLIKRINKLRRVN